VLHELSKGVQDVLSFERTFSGRDGERGV
jgi:hypothetical protein